MPSEKLRLTRRGVLRLATAFSIVAASKVFAQRDVTGRMLVDVQLNGQGPFSFLLSTGTSRSALSPELVSRLGLSSSGLVSIGSLESGALRLKDVQLAIASAEDVGAADGILGTEGMGVRKIDIDFQNGTAAIVPTNTGGAPRGVRVVPARQSAGGITVIVALLGKLPVETVIDTGAIRTSGNRALQVALGGGSTEPVPIKVAGVELGQPYLEFKEFSEEKPALRLGMDLLGFLQRMAIDYRRSEFHFKP
jgi:hypothetical protein